MNDQREVGARKMRDSVILNNVEADSGREGSSSLFPFHAVAGKLTSVSHRDIHLALAGLWASTAF
jgi:hypothetical protein